MKKPAALTGVVWVLALATVALDQLTKQWALTSLTPNQRIPILGNALGFELIFNPGAAFSFGEGATVVFTVVAGAVVLGIPFVARKVASRAWAVWLGIVWGGAAGNLVDRIFRSPGAGRGHVVDFIAYFDWFIGNVADIALVVGIAAIGILVFRGVEFGPAAGDGGAPKEDNNG
ncbi:MAG: signal peptidase II [Ancrocorticia sp.]|jgi:signal peptidase II|nr:signal peptidase II [Ancrocorticia sp.]